MEKYRYIKYNNGNNMLITTANRLNEDIKHLIDKWIDTFIVEKYN